MSACPYKRVVSTSASSNGEMVSLIIFYFIIEAKIFHLEILAAAWVSNAGSSAWKLGIDPPA